MSGHDDRRTGRGPFATLTHARLRLRQGDVRGARRILSEIVERHPGDRAARELLEGLPARGRMPGPALGMPADRRRRVIDLLEGWLQKIRRNTGDAHA